MASLNTIHGGDIVEVERNGRRAFVLVEEKGDGKLYVKAITPGFTWREVTARQVISHYRKTKNGRKLAQQ